MLHKAGRTRLVRDNGGFIANLNFPGWLRPMPRDHGHGPLAMIAESLMVPGRVIEMHEHRNDEIISCFPTNVMRHADRTGEPKVIDAEHLLVMNAGRGFWHSDMTLETDPPLRMLQIMVRPDVPDLEPRLQFGPLPIPQPDTWRHLFGPEGGTAPFKVRNRIDCFDCRARSGASIPFPAAQGERDIYFYVFDGSVEVNGQRFGEGEQGLWLGGEAREFEAREDTLLVAFLIDPGATVVRLGTVGDHPAIPRPWLAPLVRLLLATRPVSRSRP